MWATVKAKIKKETSIQVIIKEEICNLEADGEEDGALTIVTDSDVKSLKSMDIVLTSATSDLIQAMHHHNKSIIIQEISFQMSI